MESYGILLRILGRYFVMSNQMHEFFISLFDKRKDIDGYVRCYQTGTMMHESAYKYNSAIYSHCLPKKKYPQYAFEEWNVLIVTPESHSKWEAKKTNVPKMYAYYQDILTGLWVKEVEEVYKSKITINREALRVLKLIKHDYQGYIDLDQEKMIMNTPDKK